MKNKLKEILKEKNISQRELANKINVTESAVSKYVHNVRTPKTIILMKMAKVLNVRMEDILNV